jgi:hypothetical protein
MGCERPLGSVRLPATKCNEDAPTGIVFFRRSFAASSAATFAAGSSQIPRHREFEQANVMKYLKHSTPGVPPRPDFLDSSAFLRISRFYVVHPPRAMLEFGCHAAPDSPLRATPSTERSLLP